MMKPNLQSFAEGLMENSFRIGWIIITISLLSLAMGLTSCGSDDEKEADPQDLIHKTWVLGTDGSVMKDGSDVTEDYAGLKVTFSDDGTYTAVNSGHFFNASGTWAWQGDGVTNILTDGDFSIDVTELTETVLHLHLTLDADDLEGGRTKGLVGEYDLTLSAQ